MHEYYFEVNNFNKNFLLEKINNYRNVHWNDEKKIKHSLNNQKTKNKNSSEYKILCPNGNIITLIGRNNVKKFIEETNQINQLKISVYGILDRGESKGYKLIEKKKIYKKQELKNEKD